MGQKPSVPVSAGDLEKLKTVEDTLSRNVLASQSNAMTVFRKNARLSDIFKLVTRRRKWLSKEAKNAPADVQAQALLAYCSAALPVMKRSFGEDVLVKSLPEVAKEQGVIDLCRKLGADGIADLCEKARQTPSATPAAPGPGPTA